MRLEHVLNFDSV